ncbi:MAG: hypothetical protein LBN97_07660 [Oscillospiraceae bacterium]|jgi:hypothetical protein|nr:hypothetical protein [Oscillospiraceae bacterium]
MEMTIFPVIKAKYKVTQILGLRKDYATLSAVNIMERERGEYILNVYESDALSRRYAAIYDELLHCPDFIEIFLSDNALIAVFKASYGKPIDDVFYKGANLPAVEKGEAAWETRLHYAEALMHLALTISDFPLEISCAALLSENLYIDNNTFQVRYAVSPLAAADKREFRYLLGDQMFKILLPAVSAPKLLGAFLEKFYSEEADSITKLYSEWRELLPEITNAYKEFFAKTLLARGIAVITNTLKRERRKK